MQALILGALMVFLSAARSGRTRRGSERSARRARRSRPCVVDRWQGSSRKVSLQRHTRQFRLPLRHRRNQGDLRKRSRTVRDSARRNVREDGQDRRRQSRRLHRARGEDLHLRQRRLPQEVPGKSGEVPDHASSSATGRRKRGRARTKTHRAGGDGHWRRGASRCGDELCRVVLASAESTAGRSDNHDEDNLEFSGPRSAGANHGAPRQDDGVGNDRGA